MGKHELYGCYLGQTQQLYLVGYLFISLPCHFGPSKLFPWNMRLIWHGLTTTIILNVNYLITYNNNQNYIVSMWYFGPGKRNTGDWCFEDGFITFRDIAELYVQYFSGKILSVSCDCSYGGRWVTACAEFLDSNGVQPCAHSAKAKNIFISMKASCKDTEVPYFLLYSIRAFTSDKNTGVLGIKGDGWEVSQGQHMKRFTTTIIECENKSIDASCTLEPYETWAKLLNNQRIFLVRGSDKGRPAWHYAQLVDDEETVRKFTELTQGENAGIHTINIEDYGQVIKSGFGHDPPNDVKEWMQKNYSAS